MIVRAYDGNEVRYTSTTDKKTEGRKYLNPIKNLKISIYLLESKVRNNTIEWNNCIGSNFFESDIIVGLLLDQPEIHSDNPLSRII